MQLHAFDSLPSRPPSVRPAIARPLAQRLAGDAFLQVWGRLSVYNILFEDAEVDEALLGLGPSSRVCAISGAGCGVAGMLSASPARIDAVDLNPHHLALTALKCAGARHERSMERFEAMFRHGRVRSSLDAVGSLARDLPSWAQHHWRRHHRIFETGLYASGLTAKMLAAARAVAGLDAGWLRSLVPLDRSARIAHLRQKTDRLLAAPLAGAWLSSPAQLVALGIHFEQRDRILATEGLPDMASFIVAYLERLADTDLATNWFVWYAAAGQFDPGREDCAPPYLRRERHERALASSTDLRFHRRGIVDYLRTRSPGSFTHYTLLDVPDWLPPHEQRALFFEIRRTARPGATVLFRSVEDESPIERLGLERHLVLDAKRTRIATSQDRTRQYRQVRYYEVQP